MGINKWHKKPLKSLCTRIGDGLHGTPTYDESSEFYFINGNNLKNGNIEITNNTNTVTKEDFNKNFIPLNENTLLLSINGTLGSMAFYNNEKIMLGKSAAYINFKEDVNKFYYYYFQLKEIQEYFHNVATGSTIKNLSLKSIQDFEVPTPDKIELKNISNVLSSLDSKIELNNKINKELEAMAKTLYDYWFVQFDFPDENGKPYKSSGGKMVYSQELKREIPEGWEVDSLWNIATYFNGLAMQKHRPVNDNKLRVIKIKEMNEGFGDYTEYAKADVQKEAIINNGDILFSWSASLDVIIWAKGIGALNQHIFKVTSKKYPRSFYYYELINYLKHFKMMADLRKTTMGHITQEHLKQSKIVIPPIDLIIALDSKINVFIEKQILLEQQNQEVAKLRDWLLPMLMNGQVSVK
jgi:type I restriction enzyme, S subunit